MLSVHYYYHGTPTVITHDIQVMSVCMCVQDVTASMDEGLAKVNYVCDQAEKILPNTSVEGKKLIEQQVTELTNDWVCCFLPSLCLLWESVCVHTLILSWVQDCPGSLRLLQRLLMLCSPPHPIPPHHKNEQIRHRDTKSLPGIHSHRIFVEKIQ